MPLREIPSGASGRLVPVEPAAEPADDRPGLTGPPPVLMGEPQMPESERAEPVLAGPARAVPAQYPRTEDEPAEPVPPVEPAVQAKPVTPKGGVAGNMEDRNFLARYGSHFISGGKQMIAGAAGYAGSVPKDEAAVSGAPLIGPLLIRSAKKLVASRYPPEVVAQYEAMRRGVPTDQATYSFLRDWAETIRSTIMAQVGAETQKANQRILSGAEWKKALTNPAQAVRMADAALTSALDSAAQTLSALTPAGMPLMIATEAESLSKSLRGMGIKDDDLIAKYAGLYGVPAGLVEYQMDKFILKPLKLAGGDKIAAKVFDAMSKRLMTSVLMAAGVTLTKGAGEGAEEVVQGSLEDALTYMALGEAAKNDPANAAKFNEQRKAITLSGTLKADIDRFIIGAVAGVVMGGAADAVTAIQNRKEFQANLSRLRAGKMDVPEFQAWLNSQGRGDWRVVPFDPSRESAPDGAVVVPYELRPRAGEPGGGLRAYAERVPVPGGRPSGTMQPAKPLRDSESVQAVAGELTRAQAGADPVSIILASAPPEEPARPAVPAVVLPANAPAPVRQAAANVAGILDVLPRSSLALGRAKAEKAGRQDAAQQVAGKVQDILTYMAGMTEPSVTRDAAGRAVMDLTGEEGKAGEAGQFMPASPARPAPAVTPEQDRAYLQAVEAGDTATAQRMVDEAAKAAGYTVGPVWHGGTMRPEKGMAVPELPARTGIDREWFGVGFNFTKHQAEAEQFARGEHGGPDDERVPGVATRYFLRIPRMAHNEEPYVYPLRHPRVNQIKDEYDGANIGHVARGEDAPWYIVKDASQIKSAEPITRDDQGRVIPLSERFQQAQPDIRFMPARPSFSQARAAADPAVQAEVDREMRARLGPAYAPEWLDRLTTPDGQAALGRYREGITSLVRGTGLEREAGAHESVHAAEDLLLTQAERAAIEAAAPDAEARANAFIVFTRKGDWKAVLAGTKAWQDALPARRASLAEKTGLLFDMLWTRMKALFGANKGVDKVQEVYDRLARGELAKRGVQEQAYPVAGKKVDNRIVRRGVPNTDSIAASLSNYTELPGIREVPMSDFVLTGKHYSVDGTRRIEALAGEIAASGEISPLIVVQEAAGPYILEGATRAEALFRLGAKSFPALVVVDMDNPPVSPGSFMPAPRKREPDPVGLTRDAFDAMVDRAAAEFAEKTTPDDIRRELNRRGLAEDLNAYAKAKGHAEVQEDGKDVTRRSLTADELAGFMGERGIKLRGYKDDEAAADMIKAAYATRTPEEALRLYNEMSVQKGRAVVLDVRDAAAGGPPIPPARYALSEQERAVAARMMPARLQGTPDGQKAIARVLDQIGHPLPADPRELRATMDIYRKLAAQLVRNQRQDAGQHYASEQSLWNKLQVVENARYAFGDAATMTGDYGIWDDYRAVDMGSRAATYESELLAESLFKKAGLVKTTFTGKEKVDTTMRYWIASNPEVESAMKTIIGRSEKSPEWAAARATLDAIPDKAVRDKVDALMKSIIENQLQGVDAINARLNQLYRFEAHWNEVAKGADRTFGQKYMELYLLGDQRTPAQERAFGVLDAKLRTWLPHRNVQVTAEDGTVKNQHEQVSIEEMIRLARLWQEGGEQAVTKELSEQEGWVRKNYYMTEAELDSLMLEPTVTETPSFVEKAQDTPLRMAGEINNRTGMGVFREGDLFASLYKHSHRLRSQARTFHAANRLRRSLEGAYNEGRLPKELYTHARLWVDSEWGKYQRQPVQNRVLFQPAESAFWTTYALTAWPWYAARNVLYQGVPYGPINHHFRVGDVQRYYWESMAQRRDPNSRLSRYIARKFQSDLSNVQSVFYEQHLMADPHSYSPKGRLAGIRMERVRNFAAMAIGAPDQFNRMLGTSAYSIIDHHVERFVAGKSDKADVLAALKVPTMHVMQQRYLDGLFEKARGTDADSQEWEAFREQLTEMKVENVNYSYRISGRGLIQQEPSIRPIAGVITYAQGTANEIIQNGFRPIWQAVDGRAGKADWFKDPAFRQGMAVLGKTVFTHAIASAIAGYLIGEKRDLLRKGQPGEAQPTAPDFSLHHSLVVSPIRPGMALALGLWENGVQLAAKAVYSSPEDFKAEIDWFMKTGLYYVPIAGWAGNMMEAHGNYRAAENFGYLAAHFASMNEDEQRNAWEKFVQHPMFGTAEFHDARWDMPLWEGAVQRLIDGAAPIPQILTTGRRLAGQAQEAAHQAQ